MTEVTYDCRMEISKLCEIFQDRSRYALLVFLLPIVEQCERLNALFQVNNLILIFKRDSVSYQHSQNVDPDPAFLNKQGSGSR
jgi:hypothetical protein